MSLLSSALKKSFVKWYIYETHYIMHFQIFYSQLPFTRFRLEYTSMPESLDLRISVALVHKKLDISSQG